MTDLVPIETIVGKILVLRGEKVLLDRATWQSSTE